MSTLGKILVFVNLVFSLIVGALIVMVFATRIQWQKGYERVAGQLAGERAAHVSTIERTDKIVGETNKQFELKQAELKETTKTLEATEAKLKQAAKDKADADVQMAATNATMKKMEAERDNLTTELANKDKLISEQLTQINLAQTKAKEASEREVRYKIAAESTQARMENLLVQYEKLLKEFESLRADRAARAGTINVNPPPEDVKGTIKSTDTQSGLVTVNLGSDNGLTKGNTLHVYRLAPRPTYVGLLRIMDVRPNESVGKLTTSTTRPGTVQVGDEVASKILDNR